MTIHAALNHVTHYSYDRLVNLGPQTIRLRPAPHCRSKIISYSLKVEPEGHFINWQQDPFANYQARLVFPDKAKEFKVTVDVVMDMAVYNPFDFFLEPDAEEFPFNYEANLKQELAPYLTADPVTPLLQAQLDKIDRTKRHDSSPLLFGIGLGDSRGLINAGDRHVMGKLDLGLIDTALNRCSAGWLRRTGQRNMAFARQQTRSGIEPNPAGTGQINLAPGVQVGKVHLGAARAVE